MRTLVKKKIAVLTSFPKDSCARSAKVRFAAAAASVGSRISLLVCPTAFCASVFFSGPGFAPSAKFPAEFTRHRPRVASGAFAAAYSAASAPMEFPAITALSLSDARATSFANAITCSPQNSMLYGASTLGDHPYPSMHSAYTRKPRRASAGMV